MAPETTASRLRSSSLFSTFSGFSSRRGSNPPLPWSSRFDQFFNEKGSTHNSGNDGEKSPTLPIENNISQIYEEDAVLQDVEAQRIVRTIPTWVHTLDENDEDLVPCPDDPRSPSTAHVAQHHVVPSVPFWNAQSARGRRHDRQRESIPPVPRANELDQSSRWRAFAKSSQYAPPSGRMPSELVTAEWLAEHGADYSKPWLEGGEEGDASEQDSKRFRSRIKRRALHLRIQRTLLRSPVIPFVIRMIVFGFSTIALGLAASMHQKSAHNDFLANNPSNKMAIIVDAVAMVYLVYIAYDEYSSKPLGLRNTRAKLRLLFLDLIFIVFDSSNLSLAFEAASSERYCGEICGKQKALAAVLLIALIAWLVTFAISVSRVVERMNAR